MSISCTKMKEVDPRLGPGSHQEQIYIWSRDFHTPPSLPLFLLQHNGLCNSTTETPSIQTPSRKKQHFSLRPCCVTSSPCHTEYWMVLNSCVQSCRHPRPPFFILKLPRRDAFLFFSPIFSLCSSLLISTGELLPRSPPRSSLIRQTQSVIIFLPKKNYFHVNDPAQSMNDNSLLFFLLHSFIPEQNINTSLWQTCKKTRLLQ